jgi:LmbE family N-acetylglucosaminyl deacetylase
LPHFTIKDAGLAAIDGTFDLLQPDILRALRLCDGTRKLIDIARQTGVAKSQLVQLHDQGRMIFWFVPVSRAETPQAHITTVIVSPHPDDAALSAFMWMHKVEMADGGGVQPLVLDVFSRATWWRFAPPDSVEEIQRVRHDEERLVTSLTGARLQMLDLPEALLRGYTMHDVFQPPVASRDSIVRAALAAAIEELTRESVLWLLPLGIGNHVDHVIARDETLAALEHAGVPNHRIFFYEDLPYAADQSGIPNFSDAIPGRHLRPGSRGPIPGNIKFECLRAYWSQLTWRQIELVREYARRVGSGTPEERVWQFLHH